MENNPNNEGGDLMGSFRVAANSLALLYKESVTASKKSYIDGYQQAQQDMYQHLILQHSQNLQEGTPASDILKFIQTKNAEINNESFVDKDLKHSVNLEQSGISGGSSFQADEVLGKRRWNFSNGTMNLDDMVDHNTKRLRGKNDRMLD
jgi:hypothetical protein